MNENFLHYVWQYRHYNFLNAKTVDGQYVSVTYPGIHNHDAGPDFLQASIDIGGIHWVGSVEVHIRSSDWYRHRHQYDDKYNSVILHVVYEHDMDVVLANGEKIPTLQLKGLVDNEMFEKYESLLTAPDLLSCRPHLDSMERIYLSGQLSTVLLVRLLRMHSRILAMLSSCKYDWNEVIYRTLAKSFGCRTNSVAFEMLAQNVPYRTVYLHKSSALQLDALFFGASGLLEADDDSGYVGKLKYEYDYLRYKYQIAEIKRHHWNLLRLRPQNFPAVRIAQFSSLMHHTDSFLKQKVVDSDFCDLVGWLSVDVDEYWQCHYQFGKPTKRHSVSLGMQTVNSIIINAIIPLKFTYAKYSGDDQGQEKALRMYENIDYESNVLTRVFAGTPFPRQHAGDSQAQIELLQHYCSEKRCLKCSVGEKIVRATRNLSLKGR